MSGEDRQATCEACPLQNREAEVYLGDEAHRTRYTVRLVGLLLLC